MVIITVSPKSGAQFFNPGCSELMIAKQLLIGIGINLLYYTEKYFEDEYCQQVRMSTVL